MNQCDVLIAVTFVLRMEKLKRVRSDGFVRNVVLLLLIP